MISKQIEYVFVAVILFIVAFTVLTVAQMAETDMIWLSSIIITFIKAIAWVFIGLGFACILAVWSATIRGLIKYVTFQRNYRR